MTRTEKVERTRSLLTKHGAEDLAEMLGLDEPEGYVEGEQHMRWTADNMSNVRPSNIPFHVHSRSGYGARRIAV